MTDEFEWPESPVLTGARLAAPVRHPNAVPAGEQIPVHYAKCFGCGTDHEDGLHIRIVAGDLSVQSAFEVAAAHQGAPGLAHGGLLATAVDETLGALNWLLMRPAVTVRLETDFRKPVPVGATLRIDAELVGIEGRKVFTRGVGRVGDDVVLTAVAVFVQVPVEHFLEHGDPDEVRAAAAARSRDVAALEVNP